MLRASAIRKRGTGTTLTSTTRFAARRNSGSPGSKCAIVSVLSRVRSSPVPSPSPESRIPSPDCRAPSPEPRVPALAFRPHRHLLANERGHPGGCGSHVAAARRNQSHGHRERGFDEQRRVAALAPLNLRNAAGRKNADPDTGEHVMEDAEQAIDGHAV